TIERSHRSIVRGRDSMRFVLILLVTLAFAAPAVQSARARRGIMKQSFGKTPAGEAVDLYTLTNSGGMEARITNYGGIVVSLKAPDRGGRMDDVVLGYDTLGGYLDKSPYFGAIVGRYANRIAKGEFTLDGVTYRV